MMFVDIGSLSGGIAWSRLRHFYRGIICLLYKCSTLHVVCRKSLYYNVDQVIMMNKICEKFMTVIEDEVNRKQAEINYCKCVLLFFFTNTTDYG